MTPHVLVPVQGDTMRIYHPVKGHVQLLVLLVMTVELTNTLTQVYNGTVQQVEEDSTLTQTVQFLNMYQKELDILMGNEEAFMKFKMYDPSRPLVWMVLFGATPNHNYTHISWILNTQFTHLRDIYVQESSYYQLVGGNSRSTDLRYIYDLAIVERIFRISPRGFHGKTVLEVGGGYGGFAHVFSAAHNLLAYVVVDLEPSLEFQKKYLTLLKDSGSTVDVPYMPVSDSHTGVIKTDFFYSFLALDEVPEEIFVRYIEQYVTYAVRGYILLAASRPRMFRVFESVWAVQPTAVMLPPDIAYPNFGAVNEQGNGISARIIWDSTGTASSSLYTWC